MIRTFTPRGWGAIFAAALAAPLLPVAVGTMPTLALVNETRSLPRGLYVRRFGEDIRRGGTAALNQPASARAYLESLGAPRDRLLLKRVVAVGGDLVCRENDRVITPTGEARLLARDRRGIALEAWTGCRRLGANEVFLLGDAAESFDSRYFGPVDRSELRGVFTAVGTW